MNLSMVSDAVDRLRAQGERISLRAVRSVLGKGSLQDIHPLLRQVIREQGLSDTVEDPAPAQTALELAHTRMREAETELSAANQRVREHQRALDGVHAQIRQAREAMDIEALTPLMARELALTAVTETLAAQWRNAGEQLLAARRAVEQVEAQAAELRRQIRAVEAKLGPHGFFARYLPDLRGQVQALEREQIQDQHTLEDLREDLAKLVGLADAR